MKEHRNLHILFLGVNNRTDARVSWFSKQNIFWKNFFDSFASINFTTCLNFKNWFLLIWTFEFKKMQKKMKFLILFLCKKIRWYFVYNKKLKKIESECLVHFLQKIYFGMLNKKLRRWVSYSFSSKKYFWASNENW